MKYGYWDTDFEEARYDKHLSYTRMWPNIDYIVSLRPLFLKKLDLI